MGDLIAPYLFKKMTGRNPIRVSPNIDQTFLLSCGSIICSSSKHAIIWGTGTMVRNLRVDKPLKVLAVRGPITRQLLLQNDISCPEVYGDPGLMLPRYYTPNTGGRHYKVGVIPHYSDHKYMAQYFAAVPDILVIDINRQVEQVCDDIKACSVTISSSLHGIIVSHAYEVPCAWMTTSPHAKWPLMGGKLKYMDYYLARNISQLEPYLWNMLPKNATQLYNLIKMFPQPTDTVDIDKLVETCPFGKTRAQILEQS